MYALPKDRSNHRRTCHLPEINHGYSPVRYPNGSTNQLSL